MLKPFAFLIFLLIAFGCSENKPIEVSAPSTPEDLLAHSAEFKKEVIEVTEGIHVAVG